MAGAAKLPHLSLSKWYEFRSSKFAYIEPPITLYTAVPTKLLYIERQEKKLYVITRNTEIRDFQKQIRGALEASNKDEKMEE